MKDYGPNTYGERMAGVYDEWAGVPQDAEETVAFLAELAGPGPVLELGVGTGRIALPLARKGFEVHGIDASDAMTNRLREKPGGESVRVTLGDFADFDLGRRFPLVYVVFNTFFALLSQEDQIRCFGCVARHLHENGAFVIEAFMPDPARFTDHQAVQTKQIEVDRAILEVSRHDPVNQRVSSHSIVMSETGIELYPVEIRYAWPSELDLMARLAGMRLRERWSNWRHEPFTTSSTGHVSVYGV